MVRMKERPEACCVACLLLLLSQGNLHSRQGVQSGTRKATEVIKHWEVYFRHQTCFY
jgi:hypothetical protein